MLLQEKFYSRRQTHLPTEIIRHLACDESWSVRREVARQSTLPHDILQKLSEDEHCAVRHEISKRADISNSILKNIKNIDLEIEKRLSQRLFPDYAF